MERRPSATLEDHTDTAAVCTFLKNPTETFPDAVMSAILNGTSPLKALRKHRGLTQAGLANASGTNAVNISQIERGERRAGRKLLAKLGRALQVEAGLLEQHD